MVKKWEYYQIDEEKMKNRVFVKACPFQIKKSNKHKIIIDYNE